MARRKRESRYLWGIAALVPILGCLIASLLFYKSGIGEYPSLIAEAYKSPLHKVEVPGDVDLVLSRKGAYGIYYESYQSAFDQAEIPPTLDCSLTSLGTGEDVALVPDYVVSNRYVTKGGQTGVLIYSTTIDHPGLHTLSCDYPDGRVGPQLALAIGPNYVWEFLRLVWNIGGPVLGGVGSMCSSLLLSITIALVAFVRGRGFHRERDLHEVEAGRR